MPAPATPVPMPAADVMAALARASRSVSANAAGHRATLAATMAEIQERESRAGAWRRWLAILMLLVGAMALLGALNLERQFGDLYRVMGSGGGACALEGSAIGPTSIALRMAYPWLGTKRVSVDAATFLYLACRSGRMRTSSQLCGPSVTASEEDAAYLSGRAITADQARAYCQGLTNWSWSTLSGKTAAGGVRAPGFNPLGAQGCCGGRCRGPPLFGAVCGAADDGECAASGEGEPAVSQFIPCDALVVKSADFFVLGDPNYMSSVSYQLLTTGVLGVIDRSMTDKSTTQDMFGYFFGDSPDASCGASSGEKAMNAATTGVGFAMMSHMAFGPLGIAIPEAGIASSLLQLGSIAAGLGLGAATAPAGKCPK